MILKKYLSKLACSVCYSSLKKKTINWCILILGVGGYKIEGCTPLLLLFQNDQQMRS